MLFFSFTTKPDISSCQSYLCCSWSCFSFSLRILASWAVLEGLCRYFLFPLHSYVQWPNSKHFWHLTCCLFASLGKRRIASVTHSKSVLPRNIYHSSYDYSRCSQVLQLFSGIRTWAVTPSTHSTQANRSSLIKTLSHGNNQLLNLLLSNSCRWFWLQRNHWNSVLQQRAAASSPNPAI